MKLTLQLSQDFTEDDLRYAQQIGVEHVTVSSTGGGRDFFRSVKQRVDAAGLILTNVGNTDVHNMPSVTLGLPDRDQKIDAYIEHLRAMAEIGMTYTTYAHMANGIWGRDRRPARGGASARSYTDGSATGFWAGTTYPSTGFSHGRAFSEDEIWDNFAYFVRRVVPVAEELGIRIGLHPDDPPGVPLGGVPRCIASSWEGYQRAFDIADSPNFGACLCLGTWLEGGATMGRTPTEAIRGFAAQDKLWKIHFRNVSSPMPDFVESFIDSGYGDMREYLKTLAEVGFDGTLIVDHVPQMIGDSRNAWSWSIGYVKGMMDALGIPTA
ncbi:mannonate dehydratase [Microlunatus endophyticus]|uniref:mannonate dehydratase n=1 Tax=Microlunatus endophyticus TaxID=1716077 RepID=A0A917SDK8_9ACTN|nr:mannonate dehydratase [Microlunatus endophyticus]GGL72740.1 mannonate dehydratase [Microlunatus endophyticus]